MCFNTRTMCVCVCSWFFSMISALFRLFCIAILFIFIRFRPMNFVCARFCSHKTIALLKTNTRNRVRVEFANESLFYRCFNHNREKKATGITTTTIIHLVISNTANLIINKLIIFSLYVSCSKTVQYCINHFHCRKRNVNIHHRPLF